MQDVDISLILIVNNPSCQERNLKLKIENNI